MVTSVLKNTHTYVYFLYVEGYQIAPIFRIHWIYGIHILLDIIKIIILSYFYLVFLLGLREWVIAQDWMLSESRNNFEWVACMFYLEGRLNKTQLETKEVKKQESLLSVGRKECSVIFTVCIVFLFLSLRGYNYAGLLSHSIMAME